LTNSTSFGKRAWACTTFKGAVARNSVARGYTRLNIVLHQRFEPRLFLSPCFGKRCGGRDQLLSNNVRQNFECLGLSEYEAKLYVSLPGGTANAGTLSISSSVPRTKVYSILKKLTDIGLVVEIPEEPRRFAPTPPRNAFEPYLHLCQNMFDSTQLVRPQF
jgi:hypothetical protein